MSEITKLYENAGIEPRCNIYPTFYDCAKYPHEKCEDCVEWEYPPFTAEKRLELIKWLSQYCITIDCEDGEYEVYTVLDDDVIENFYDKLEDAIAYCVNIMWQDLSPEEKQQVKGILEVE